MYYFPFKRSVGVSGLIYGDRFRVRINGDKCVYCGEAGDTDEHFPPRSVTHRGVIIPCCRECNNLAGVMSPIDFNHRVKIVKDGIRRKHRKVLKMPEWDEDEFHGMSNSMIEEIKRWSVARKIINERLAWNARLYLLHIAKGKDFAAILVECDLIIGNVKPRWNPIDGFTESSEELSDLIDFKEKFKHYGERHED